MEVQICADQWTREIVAWVAYVVVIFVAVTAPATGTVFVVVAAAAADEQD